MLNGDTYDEINMRNTRSVMLAGTLLKHDSKQRRIVFPSSAGLCVIDS